MRIKIIKCVGLHPWSFEETMYQVVSIVENRAQELVVKYIKRGDTYKDKDVMETMVLGLSFLRLTEGLSFLDLDSIQKLLEGEKK